MGNYKSDLASELKGSKRTQMAKIHAKSNGYASTRLHDV
jgi:hypothetical protein